MPEYNEEGKRIVDLDPDMTKWARRESSTNGKGSRSRGRDKSAFERGYDQIDWSAK